VPHGGTCPWQCSSPVDRPRGLGQVPPKELGGVLNFPRPTSLNFPRLSESSVSEVEQREDAAVEGGPGGRLTWLGWGWGSGCGLLPLALARRRPGR